MTKLPLAHYALTQLASFKYLSPLFYRLSTRFYAPQADCRASDSNCCDNVDCHFRAGSLWMSMEFRSHGPSRSARFFTWANTG